MSRIPIASLANGVLFATQVFTSPSNPAGVPVLTPAVGVSCFVNIHDTPTPAAIWTDELNSVPLVQPLTTDATGTVPGWIDTSLLPLDLTVALPTGNVTFVLAGGGSGGGGGGSIASVFGRTGSVTAQIGDYTASQVGADAAGSATSEQSRAQIAEALLAPKASPALTGTPTVPTATPLTNTTQAASTAYSDAAVAIETTRASMTATSIPVTGTVSHPTELLDATSAPFTRTLPTAVGFVGSYRLVAVTTGLNLVTIAITSAQTITPPVGAAVSTVTLGSPASGAPYSALTLVSDGSNWRVV